MNWKIKIVFMCSCVAINALAQFNYKLKEIAPAFFKNSVALPNALSGGLNYCSISRVDVNNDNKKDLVFFDKVDGKAHVYINNNSLGNINYLYNSAYTQGFPPLFSFCLLVDYNGDGKEDVFTSSGNGIVVYKNISTNTFFGFELASKKFGALYTNYFPKVPTYLESKMYNGGDALPGIYDLDGDGDLEIFTFDIGGYTIDVHKNLSKEMYGHTDSLVFERIDDCFGRFRETNCQSFSLYPTSQDTSSTTNKCNLAAFKSVQDNLIQHQAKVQHAGASILIFDPDKDGDADVLLGDISCDSIKFFRNVPINGFNVMNNFTIDYPNTNDPVSIFQYPSCYYVDIDDDGKKELLVSPNKTQAENQKSIFLYKNYATSITAKDSFELVSKAFMQDVSIDVGEQAYPVLYDLDKDGDLDLLIGSGFFIDATDNNLRKSTIYHYKNTGTVTNPVFTYVTDDFLNIKSFALKNLRPAFGDLDSDGDDDLLLGNFSGTFIAFKNTAGAGQVPVFIPDVNKIPSSINVGNLSSPVILDVNKDGKNDIISGQLNGKLSLLLQQSNGTFTINKNWGGLNFSSTTIPTILTYNNINYLSVGLNSGALYLYDTIEAAQNNTLKPLNSNIFSIASFFNNAAPTFGDLDNDSKPDLVVGNLRGGIYIFKGDTAKGAPFSISIDYIYNETEKAKLYPNPASTEVFISNVRTQPIVYCTDIIGRNHPITYDWNERNKTVTINVSNLMKGAYILKCNTKQGNVLNKKIIKE